MDVSLTTTVELLGVVAKPQQQHTLPVKPPLADAARTTQPILVAVAHVIHTQLRITCACSKQWEEQYLPSLETSP